MRLTSGPALKLNPRNFRSCGPRHRTLRFVYLEVELVCDESRDALHHPLTGPLAAHVDVAIIRVAQVAVSASVEFIEYEVGAFSNATPHTLLSALGTYPGVASEKALSVTRTLRSSEGLDRLFSLSQAESSLRISANRKGRTISPLP